MSQEWRGGIPGLAVKLKRTEPLFRTRGIHARLKVKTELFLWTCIPKEWFIVGPFLLVTEKYMYYFNLQCIRSLIKDRMNIMAKLDFRSLWARWEYSAKLHRPDFCHFLESGLCSSLRRQKSTGSFPKKWLAISQHIYESMLVKQILYYMFVIQLNPVILNPQGERKIV